MSMSIAVQQFVMTDSTAQAVYAEAVGPLMAFSQMGVMAWPITFCLVMVIVLAVRAVMRIRSSEPEQRALARGTIDGSFFWGAYAVPLGILGTVVGFMVAAQAVEAFGSADPRLVWGGVKVALSTTVYGLLIFLVASVTWFVLRHWHRKAVLGAV